MSPLSLLFSSDEETSRALAQALQELELEVEFCPEIFGAVEKLTSRSYEVIVCDCDEGPEAVFLLKTSHELRSNKAAFTLAIGSPGSVAPQPGRAHLVLRKPITPEQAKYALLSCDDFLAHMKTWLPKLGFAAPDAIPRSWPVKEAAASGQARSSYSPLPRPVQPSPLPLPNPQNNKLPTAPTFALTDALFRGSHIQTLFRGERRHDNRTSRQRLGNSWLRVTALAVVFLSVGYLFSEPLRSESVAASVAVICGRALQRTQAWFHTSDQGHPTSPTLIEAQSDPQPADHYAQLRHRSAATVHARNETPGDVPPQPVLQAEPRQPSLLQVSAQSRIPESLRVPLHAIDPRTVATKYGPSLLASLEPVSVPEELAQKLLLEKIQPSYPEQALRAGMQGPVVLQAWIARDGTIRELKLLRGSLLLGQAAYQAVKQWRYQPYLLNGRPVEAQTLVTVDFRLP
jgi:TonB family protein